MASLSSPILFIFLSVLVALPIFAAARGAIAGGWKPIENLNDPEVVMVAKFAVTEHNKEAHASLVFLNVVKGESQVVAGTNYQLEISAKDGAVAKDGAAASPMIYRAVVYYRPWDKLLKLVSFQRLLKD